MSIEAFFNEKKFFKKKITSSSEVDMRLKYDSMFIFYAKFENRGTVLH